MGVSSVYNLEPRTTPIAIGARTKTR